MCIKLIKLKKLIKLNQVDPILKCFKLLLFFKFDFRNLKSSNCSSIVDFNFKKKKKKRIELNRLCYLLKFYSIFLTFKVLLSYEFPTIF